MRTLHVSPRLPLLFHTNRRSAVWIVVRAARANLLDQLDRPGASRSGSSRLGRYLRCGRGRGALLESMPGPCRISTADHRRLGSLARPILE